MSHSTVVAPVRVDGASANTTVFRWPLVVAVTAMLLLWLEVILQLQSEWSLNPQYGYGWTVPFLAAWLSYQRWLQRPTPAPSRWPGLTISVLILTATILLPARWISVANPDWRMLSWTLALVAVVLSLGAVHLAGGIRWTRHFAFPILFFLVAVPWPVQFEQAVVQSLMRADTAVTIQILNVIGTLAVQHGNVIELGTGQVGIDDACTGVRSLQATFMIALFLGEFYRMSLGRRVILVVAGALIAFVCNIGRTFLLCEIAANSGTEAIHRWHDPAGFTILGICLFALWGLSLWLKPRLSLEAMKGPSRPARSSFGGLWLASALLLWIACTEIAVASWYAPRQAQTASQKSWTVSWPTNESDYRSEPIPEAVETLLRYNEGGSAIWRSADDRRWMMYSFHWLPGRTAALFVKNHRPDICLPASGLTMEQESDIQLVTVNGINLPIRSYRFDDRGRPLHIFYCYWDGRSAYTDATAVASEDWTARGRIQAAWQGKRELGTRMLELAVWGHEDDAAARSALQHELEKVVRPL
ncbi:MAG: exosortase/archaeosortase family protein [Chthoniobacterales bacterium]